MAQSVPDFRVLVADPSSHMAGLVTLMLHSLKIRAVDEAGDLPRTAAALARRPYDLLLLDEQLGGKNGFEMISVLRRSVDHPNRLMPIIMMAAAPDAAMIAAARDAGVTEFLRKPFAAQHIALRIEAMRSAPRPFIEYDEYAGPDRRRRTLSGSQHRRSSDEKRSA